ncbi:MAG: hypothetical protein M1268_04690 [Patescibacteria group bacterium]|nr:hypothetical protein [Patescibacteria group bacterium]
MKIKTLKTSSKLFLCTMLGFGLVFCLEKLANAKIIFPSAAQSTISADINPKTLICQADPPQTIDQSSILGKQAMENKACLFIGCGGFF